jgi:hypothetical protein
MCESGLFYHSQAEATLFKQVFIIDKQPFGELYRRAVGFGFSLEQRR